MLSGFGKRQNRRNASVRTVKNSDPFIPRAGQEPLGKKLLYKLVRVHDYERASPVMQQTLMKVTSEDLRPLLSEIHVPTDIFWGTDDQMTPVGDATVIHEGIKGSRLHIFKGVRHRVHRERAGEIADVIQKESFKENGPEIFH